MKHATPYRSKDCARISTLAVLREHIGSLDETKVSAAMTERLMTVSSRAAFEQAAKLMLSQKISGFPVADEGMLVGIITMSDVLQAFLDVMGVSEEGSSRIDFLLEQDHDLALASKTVAEKGGEVIGVETHRDSWDANRVCYLHVRTTEADRLADALKEKGYTVWGVHV